MAQRVAEAARVHGPSLFLSDGNQMGIGSAVDSVSISRHYGNMGLVIELQRAAQDEGIRVSALLRRALVVARKLNLPEFERWISQELNGYTSEVPDYRFVRGRVSVRNPYHGWQPVVFENAEMAEMCSQRALGDSVPKLETWKPGDQMGIPLPDRPKQDLMAAMHPVPLEPVLLVDYSVVASVLDTVRTSVLEWSLRLEQDGILGKDDTFSPAEKERATHNVQNFFGDVVGSQVVQGESVADIRFDALPGVIEQVRSRLKSDFDPDSREEIEAELRTVEAQLSSPKPKRGIIQASLRTVRDLLVAGGASVLAQIVGRAIGM